MKQNSLLATTALTALLFTACQKEVEQVLDESGVRYQLHTTHRTSNFSARTQDSVTWTSGFADVREIGFEGRSANTQFQYKSSVGRRIDLFASLSTLGFIPIPPGAYKEVKFKVQLAPRSGEPALQLKGSWAGTPVTLQMAEIFELEATYEDLAITQNNGYTAVIDIDLSLLTRDIPEDVFNVAMRTNGQILISPSMNSALYWAMVSNLHQLEHVDFKDDVFHRGDYDGH